VLPMDENTGELGEKKFNDGYAECVELVLSELLSKFITKPASTCSEWIKCVNDIYYIMITLRQRPYCNDAETLDLEKKITVLSDQWIELTRREGMTNYMHLITSGNISGYLNRWRNLYICFNQGWEYQNASIQCVYHDRSQHGGSGGKTGGRISIVKPLGVWFLRKL
jgi:hypothetical protein